MHRDDGVQLVDLTREQRLLSKLLAEVAERSDLARKVFLDRLALACQVEVRIDVLSAAFELFRVGEQRLHAPAIAHDRLRERRIGPQRRIRQFRFYRGKLPAETLGVKGTPAGPGLFRGRESRRIRDRRSRGT